jgi:hypothetical protein
MAKSYLTDINLNKNSLLNAKVHVWGSAPSGTTLPDGTGTAIQGQISSYQGALYIFNGTAWVQVGNALTDSTSTTSSTIGASATAVKSAYDLANAALPKSGGTMTGAIDLGSTDGITGYKITGLKTPSNQQDAATKAYVDTIATGINAHDAVSYASTANVTAPYNNGTSGVGATISGTNGPLVIDGYTVVAGDAGTNVAGGTGLRILLKDQTFTDSNGIYTVTSVSGANYTLTRAYDYDTIGEVAAGDFTYVLNGNANAKFTFIQTSKPAAISGVGTTANAITFGILANGNISGTVAVNQGGTGATTLSGVAYGNGTSAFTAATGAQIATAIGSSAVTKATNIAGGVLGSVHYQSAADTTSLLTPNTTTTKKFLRQTGDGTNSAAPAWDTLVYGDLPTNVGVVARKVSLVGTGSGTTIALTHGLGTNLVTAQVYDTSTATATLVETDITVTSTVATATFAATTTLSNYTLVVIG